MMPNNRKLHTVAIIDDEPGVVGTYKLLFSRHQIPLSFIAQDGFEALEKYSKVDPKPKVVILDYKMPYMSGIETMTTILKLEPETKIIMITADESIKLNAIDAGVKVFLVKPVNLKIIMSAVNNLLNE